MHGTHYTNVYKWIILVSFLAMKRLMSTEQFTKREERYSVTMFDKIRKQNSHFKNIYKKKNRTLIPRDFQTFYQFPEMSLF